MLALIEPTAMGSCSSLKALRTRCSCAAAARADDAEEMPRPAAIFQSDFVAEVDAGARRLCGMCATAAQQRDHAA
jgi:hypothetical protein